VTGRRPGRRRPIRIGLTGPIGCGKSTVAGWLEELGAFVIDADDLAREVTAPGEPTLAAVLERFGEAYRSADGGLDRAAVGRHVFDDPEALRDLEAIVHPAVRVRIEAALASDPAKRAPATVIEAIKLVEGGLATLCDEIWLVTCEPAVQRERMVRRGADPAEAVQRMAAQGDISARLRPAAARVVDSSSDRQTTHRIVLDAWAELGL
jgi:dephospho-CoA kinase